MYRSISDSAFVGKSGPLVKYLRSSDGDLRSERLELVSQAIEEMLSIVPAAARSVYHLLYEFFWADSVMLLSVIRRLLPESASIEQMEWHELPLVMTQHEVRAA